MSAGPAGPAMAAPGATPERGPEIEFWFEFGSMYSYLSVMRIEDAARRHGVRIVWKPFLLGPIFRALGMETSPFVLQKEKGAYVWRDMARQCHKYGLPWRQPGTFPRIGLLPARIALLGAGAPWIGAFCREVMALNFVLDADIGAPERLGHSGRSPPRRRRRPGAGAGGGGEGGAAGADPGGARPRGVRRPKLLRGIRNVLGK